MKQNINMKDQLSDIQSIIWGCPVRILMHLLRLMLVNYNLKLLTQGDVQILIQLTPAECLLCARCCQALTVHILVICKDAR